MPRKLLSLILCAITTGLPAAPREAEWRQVEQLIAPVPDANPFAERSPADQAKAGEEAATLDVLLANIQAAAFAEQAWPEGMKALALRLGRQNIYEGGLPHIIRLLDDGIHTVPAGLQAMLRCLQAHYYAIYYTKNQRALASRSATTVPPGDDFETWDLTRIVQQIDQCFREALAGTAITRKIPIADFAPFLEKPYLGDEFRPTLYDFIAHEALQFSLLRLSDYQIPEGNAYEIEASSPVFGPVEEFLRWQPTAEDKDSPTLRALRLLQDLLAFHQNDPDPGAFLHCNLERFRWAYLVAEGPRRAKRFESAIRGFIAANAKHPVSADARQDIVRILLKMKNPQDAREFALPGAETFAEHPFGKLCRDMVNDIEKKTLEFATESNWTPARESITIHHANVSHVWFRAYRQDWTPDQAAMKDYEKPKSLELLNTKPALSWDAALPDDKNFKHHVTTLPHPADLPPGYYLIVASGRLDFATADNELDTARVYVTHLTLVVKNQEAPTIAGFVTDAMTGAPAAGIDVSAWQKGETTPAMILQKTTTDVDGCFSISNRGKEREFIIAATHGDHHAAICLANRLPAKQEESKASDSKETKESASIVTDRAVYRPGQTIHFKGILCESNKPQAIYRTLAGRAATVVFRDPNGRESGKLDAVTNDYGSLSGTFTAPGGGVLGTCSLAIEGLGDTKILIEEYKRPKFHVTLMPPDAPVALGDRVVIRGKAETFAGAAVDGAHVKWHVTCLADSRNLGSGTLATAADGSFAIPFTARVSRSIESEIGADDYFDVGAEVTDTSGETCAVSYNVPIGGTSMDAYLETNEWQEESKPVIIKIHTCLPDAMEDRPIAAAGTLAVYQVKDPQAGRRFLHPVFRTGPVGNAPYQPPGDLVMEVPAKTGDSGIAEVPVALPVGTYQAVFSTKDAGGREVRALNDFTVINPAADRFPLKNPFLTISPCWEVSPGQAFTLLWGSDVPDARACIEWYKDGVLLKREWSAVDRTQQVFSYTPDESMRGGFTVYVTQTTMNRLRTFAENIKVPWTSKILKVRWEHLTSKLEPGARDTWTAVVTGPDGQAAAAEMVATLYDASLDSVQEHFFPTFNFRGESSIAYPYYPTQGMSYLSFSKCSYWKFPDSDSWPWELRHPYRIFNMLPNDYNRWSGDSGMVISGHLSSNYDYAPPEPQGGSFPCTPASPVSSGFFSDTPVPAVNQVTARRNLRETAFFYPHLTSNEKGEVHISFTMPEALTQWKFLGFAHDKNMRSGLLEGATVTAKNLMVQPNPPRFLREGDVLDFTVKIINQSDKDQTGTARLTCCDAATQKDSTAALGITAPDQPWSIPAKESRVLSWRLTVPEGAGLLTYKALATSGTLSDGEEGWLPVIPRRVMLTESLALPVRDVGSKDFTFQKLLDSKKSPTLENRMLDVQVVSQPAWYAVMALPYLMEFPHECAEQTFNRYYANALARHIANTNPKIRRIFELWKNTPAFDSPLTKNADLKGIVLEETPWLAEAAESSQARRNLGLLFDDNRLDNELDLTLKKLGEMQGDDGLWPWFPGGRGNEYISLYIATGFARLRAFGVETDITPALKTMSKLDAILTERLDAIKLAAARDPAFLTANHLDPWIAHYLYTRSYFLKDLQLSPADKVAFDYFTSQAKRYWPSLDSRMPRAHVALALARLGDVATAKLITRSLKENAVTNEETGMSWHDGGSENWWWWQAPIETQAMMIEAFLEIDHDDQAVEACRVWLIKQKQVRDWRTTKATADAIHALLMGGGDLLGNDATLQVSIGGNPLKPEGVVPGTGIYESRIAGPAIDPAMGNIKLTKSDPGVAWASVHWQYLEDIARLTDYNTTSLKLEKALYVRKHTPQGAVFEPVTGPVKIGDELVTRLVLRNDRAMEFVHLKDQRGSGTEPVNALSGYHWQDGFPYYEVTRDTASHFFIDLLPAGTHVFESSVRVQHGGTYQTGIAEIRCMYAPEFNAHSASVRIEVGR